jgi:hypothetical protein
MGTTISIRDMRRVGPRLAAWVCLAVVPLSALGAERWGGYTETVVLEPDGRAAISVRFRLLESLPGAVVELPYAYATWPDSFGHSAGVDTVLGLRNGQPARLLVTLSRTATAGEDEEIRFCLPGVAPFGTVPAGDFGNHTVSYRAVNTSIAPIDRYSVTLCLPAGWVFNDVVSTTPARPPNGAGSSYALRMQDGRHAITLTDTSVLQGTVIAMKLQARDGHKSPWLIVALVIIGGAYLITFRDLIVS